LHRESDSDALSASRRCQRLNTSERLGLARILLRCPWPENYRVGRSHTCIKVAEWKESHPGVA